MPAAGAGLDGPLDELRRQGLAEPGEPLALTDAGRAGYERLVAIRSAGLRELLDGWNPDEHPELKRVIDELARDLVGQIPQPAPVRVGLTGPNGHLRRAGGSRTRSPCL